MTTYMIHNNGDPVSIGTVIADPLQAGLTAVALSDVDATRLLSDGWRWNPATLAVDIDTSHASDDPLAAEVARLSSLLEAVLADPEIAKVADIEAIRTAAEGSKGDDALVLAVAKVLGADPAEVRKKRDENPQWFADVVAKYGLGGGKTLDEIAGVKP